MSDLGLSLDNSMQWMQLGPHTMSQCQTCSQASAKFVVGAAIAVCAGGGATSPQRRCVSCPAGFVALLSRQKHAAADPVAVSHRGVRRQGRIPRTRQGKAAGKRLPRCKPGRSAARHQVHSGLDCIAIIWSCAAHAACRHANAGICALPLLQQRVHVHTPAGATI